jgi:hypothetical protein
MEREGACQCGELRLSAAGEPLRIGVCHCLSCQRRTGSTHGFNAYYREEQVRIVGPRAKFTRAGQEGRTLTNHFCPRCGTTVYWEADAFPGTIGIAVGIFAEPDFPAPQYSVWDDSMHNWIRLPEGIVHFAGNRPFN